MDPFSGFFFILGLRARSGDFAEIVAGTGIPGIGPGAVSGSLPNPPDLPKRRSHLGKTTNSHFPVILLPSRPERKKICRARTALSPKRPCLVPRKKRGPPGGSRNEPVFSARVEIGKITLRFWVTVLGPFWRAPFSSLFRSIWGPPGALRGRSSRPVLPPFSGPQFA